MKTFIYIFYVDRPVRTFIRFPSIFERWDLFTIKNEFHTVILHLFQKRESGNAIRHLVESVLLLLNHWKSIIKIAVLVIKQSNINSFSIVSRT